MPALVNNGGYDGSQKIGLQTYEMNTPVWRAAQVQEAGPPNQSEVTANDTITVGAYTIQVNSTGYWYIVSPSPPVKLQGLWTDSALLIHAITNGT